MALKRFEPNSDDPIWRIVEHLQRQQSATIKDLEKLLGVTTTAVRQHLATLQNEGYVERRRESGGVGRPRYVYSVTAKSEELFACHCDDLALTLLEEVMALEGPEQTAILLERVGARLAGRYDSVVQASDLRGRVEEMAAALEKKGVLTDVVIGPNEEIVLQTHNCPYHELAQEHREICEMDEQIMRRVLGPDVQLSGCMMDGAGCCTFSVTEATNTEANSKSVVISSSSTNGT
jgi:DeoR family suf operon transcriptional repressor